MAMVIALAESGILPVEFFIVIGLALVLISNYLMAQKPEFCLPMLKTSEVQIVKNWDTFGS